VSKEFIKIGGAREHNLKNLTLNIPRDKLGVSPRTLEGHWRAIQRKLGSVNRCQAGFIFAALRDNRGEPGQTFTTGTNSAGYTLKSVHVLFQLVGPPMTRSEAGMRPLPPRFS
jgi:hypothetical protein